MIKNLDETKVKAILGTMPKPVPFNEIIALSGMKDKTARIYVNKLVEAGKITKYATYPPTYKRIPRNEWPTPAEDILEEIKEPPPSMEVDIVRLLKSDKELDNPILLSVRESLNLIDKGELTYAALITFLVSTTNAVHKLSKE